MWEVLSYGGLAAADSIFRTEVAHTVKRFPFWRNDLVVPAKKQRREKIRAMSAKRREMGERSLKVL